MMIIATSIVPQNKIVLNGALSRNRTYDQLLKRQLLYQLSYEGISLINEQEKYTKKIKKSPIIICCFASNRFLN